jgi:hypothetical protein
MRRLLCVVAIVLAGCSRETAPPVPVERDDGAALARAAADGTMAARRHAARSGLAPAVTGGAVAPEPTAPHKAHDGYADVDWTDLMPRAELDALRRGDAPAVDHRGARRMTQSGSFHTVFTYTGRRIRLAGYVVPVAFDDAEHVREFLFVPYFGACIHVPPPPPNQLVHVTLAQSVRAPDPWEPQWLRGTLREERVDGDLGNAAYVMDDASLAPYDG